MLTSAQLKQITAEARPIIERQLDDALKLAGLRDVVAAAGGDWSQLKALIKAQIQDEETGDGKRVRKILDKAEYANAYADMLGLGGANMNEENFIADALGITEIMRHGVNGPTPEHDADGVIIERLDDLGSVQDGRKMSTDGHPSDLATTGHTPTWPLTPADAGQIAPIHEPEAAMLPQTAGSETAVAAGAPEGEHSPHASEPIRRMSMTPLEPREAGGLKGFGFTVRFDEPETIPPVADPATVVSEAGGGDSAPSLAAIPVADRSQPNPICRDPDDCGVYASWAMPCQVCKAAAAHRSAA